VQPLQREQDVRGTRNALKRDRGGWNLEKAASHIKISVSQARHGTCAGRDPALQVSPNKTKRMYCPASGRSAPSPLSLPYCPHSTPHLKLTPPRLSCASPCASKSTNSVPVAKLRRTRRYCFVCRDGSPRSLVVTASPSPTYPKTNREYQVDN
jgi:hypothetical protein